MCFRYYQQHSKCWQEQSDKVLLISRWGLLFFPFFFTVVSAQSTSRIEGIIVHVSLLEAQRKPSPRFIALLMVHSLFVVGLYRTQAVFRGSLADAAGSATSWRCPVCGFDNRAMCKHCDLCGISSEFAEVHQRGGGGVISYAPFFTRGAHFLPLFACRCSRL